MYGWKFATRCRLFLLTLATMASYIREPLLINSFCLSSCHREEHSMLAAPTWYHRRWSMTLPGMGQRGRPSVVAVSASVICRLDRWTCLEGGPSVRQSLYTVRRPETMRHGKHTILIWSIVLWSCWEGMTWWTWPKKGSPTQTPPGGTVTHSSPTPSSYVSKLSSSLASSYHYVAYCYNMCHVSSPAPSYLVTSPLIMIISLPSSTIICVTVWSPNMSSLSISISTSVICAKMAVQGRLEPGGWRARAQCAWASYVTSVS